MSLPSPEEPLSEEEAAAELERQRQIDEGYDAALRDHARMAGELCRALVEDQGFSTNGAEALAAIWYEDWLDYVRASRAAADG